MYHPSDMGPIRKWDTIDSVSDDLDLKIIGGMAEPARIIEASTTGDIVIVNDADSSEETLTLAAGEKKNGYFRSIKADGTTLAGFKVGW